MSGTVAVLAHGAFHLGEVGTLLVGASVPFVVLVVTVAVTRRRDGRHGRVVTPDDRAA